MFKVVFRFVVAVAFFFALPHIASAQIAPGVLQSAAQTATIAGTVIQSDGTPVAGADVLLNGPGAHLTSVSDTHGTFSFTSVPYGVYRIVATAANLGTASRENIVVKSDITIAIQYVAQSGASGLKTIARVSTHSAGASINVTPANIASIRPSDYAFQGNTSWKELLDQIPGVTVGGYMNYGRSPHNAVPDSPYQPIVLSINGALPYETSVTLDGMPLNNTSLSTNTGPGGGVDLQFLPMATFDTVDVVRGPGSDTPSIVDSIGGSFVLHAPGRIDQDQFEFSASNDPYGGIVSNTKVGLHFGKLSALITYGTNNSPGPLGNQNEIPAVPFAPLTVNGQPFLECTSPASCADNSYHNPNYNVAIACGCVWQDSLLYCCASYSTVWSQHNGSVALAYDITPSVTAQVFYVGSSSRLQQPGSQFPVDFTPGAGYSGSITPGSHRYIDVSQETPLAETESLLEEKITAYIGHGVLRLAALQNNSFEQNAIPNNEPDGQYTVYGSGYYGSTPPGTPVVFNGTSAYLTFTPFQVNVDQWVNNRDFLASYALQIGTSSAVGISYVTSYYNSPYWCNGVYDIYPFSAKQSSAVSETTNELRFHASTEVSEKLSLNASWYVAKGMYHVQNPSDPTGATWADRIFPYSAPRFGAVWRASRNIAIRAAMGGGYALPQLYYLTGSNYVSCIIYCTESLTNLNLKPEQSFGFDVGADMRLHNDTVLSVDLYRANLYGQFFQSTNLTGTYLGLPLYTTQEDNLSQSRFEGINIDIRHDVLRGIYWHGALGLTRAYVINVPSGFYNGTSGFPATPCTNCENTYVVPGVNFDGEFQSTVPYATATGQIGYRWSPGKYIDLSPTYYGNNNSYFQPAFIEFDAHAGYSLTKNISLLATFRNITGIYGQNYQYIIPSMGAPAVAGAPYPLFGVPYGPRTVIVTANFKY